MLSITILIILVTAIISIPAFTNHKLMNAGILYPFIMQKPNQWYRFISSGFLHADWMHLLINMFVLYSFGTMVENYYSYFFGSNGTWLFILLYLSSLVAASASSYYKNQHNPSYRSLGASGAVSAITTASILFAPTAKIYLYGFIALPNIVAGVLYLVYSQYASRNANDHINHEAHFYGALYGIAFTLVAKPRIFFYFLEQF
jgi:membrane associated rhomboid family serine protease